MPGKHLKYINQSVLLVKINLNICLNHIEKISNNQSDAKYPQMAFQLVLVHLPEILEE